MLRLVGIGEMVISNDPQDIIITHALASCVAVTIYCRSNKTGGMIHIALPSKGEAISVHGKEAYYADSAVPLLINKMRSYYKCNELEMNIQLFGGASSISEKDHFNIGEKNIGQVEKELQKINLKYQKAETGSNMSRTIKLSVDTGKIEITKQPIKI